jgi:hypothetical protein
VAWTISPACATVTGGYQDDLIFVEDQKTLERELTARANAMRDERALKIDFSAA